ncbi:MAG: protein kinase [Candidatus Obscuribacterales bacterium]|nr:protein kinase [Candidatus Obscuribacterales bacterium]
MDHKSLEKELQREKIVAASEEEGVDCLATNDGADDSNSVEATEVLPASAAEGTEEGAAPVESSPEMLPDFGKRYVALEKIGTGGMGAVYKVLDRELDKHFAIKVLQSNLAKDSVALKRFEQEVESASKLAHPNLVAVYGYDRLPDGSPFLIMDFLEGNNLSQMIKEKGTLSCEQALDVFLQIAHGLAHAHERGVVHRDIKPTNIIVTAGADGRLTVKIVDFGIAKALPTANRETHNLTETGEVFGSPDYMSPEQCLGFMLDHRSDVYSLGCLMYEAMTGNTPFAGANPIQLVVKHINEEVPEFPAEAKRKKETQRLENVVLRCLEKDQSNRYQSMESLIGDLQAVKDGKQTSKYSRTKRAKPIFTTKAVIGLVIVIPVVLFYGMAVLFSASDASELTMRIVMAVVASGLLVGTYIFFGMAQEKYRKIENRSVEERTGWAALALGCLSVVLVSVTPWPVGLAMFGYRSPSNGWELPMYMMLEVHVVFALLTAFAGVGCLLFRKKAVVSVQNILSKFVAITVMLPLFIALVFPNLVGRGLYTVGMIPSKFHQEFSLSLVEFGAYLSKSSRFYQEAAQMADLKLGDKARAINDISKAIKLSPESEELLGERASLYERTEEYDLELRDLNAYVAGSDQGLLSRAAFFIERGKLTEALADYNKYISRNAEDRSGYVQRAKVYYRLGRLGKCVDDLSMVINTGTSPLDTLKFHLIRGLVAREIAIDNKGGMSGFEGGGGALARADFQKVIELCTVVPESEVFKPAAIKLLYDFPGPIAGTNASAREDFKWALSKFSSRFGIKPEKSLEELKKHLADSVKQSFMPVKLDL